MFVSAAGLLSRPSFLQHMKKGTIVRAIARWSMDAVDKGKILFDTRECDVNERFIVLTEPFQVDYQYMGFMVQGCNGIEMINEYVVDRKTFGQIAESYFEEIK